MEYLYTALAVVAAYLMGSLSFAVIVSRAMGLSDPRTFGSKNAGATNVLRSGSKKAALITLGLDALKGLVPVLLVRQFGPHVGLGDGTVALVALAAFLGHVWPVFFRFQGGKGVATAAGVVFAIQPLLGVCALISFAVIVAFSRRVSLASMVAALFVPMAYMMGDGVGWYFSKSIMLALFIMGVLIVIKHQANIERLLKGTEPKFSLGGG